MVGHPSEKEEARHQGSPRARRRPQGPAHQDAGCDVAAVPDQRGARAAGEATPVEGHGAGPWAQQPEQQHPAQQQQQQQQQQQPDQQQHGLAALLPPLLVGSGPGLSALAVSSAGPAPRGVFGLGLLPADGGGGGGGGGGDGRGSEGGGRAAGRSPCQRRPGPLAVALDGGADELGGDEAAADVPQLGPQRGPWPARPGASAGSARDQDLRRTAILNRSLLSPGGGTAAAAAAAAACALPEPLFSPAAAAALSRSAGAPAASPNWSDDAFVASLLASLPGVDASSAPVAAALQALRRLPPPPPHGAADAEAEAAAPPVGGSAADGGPAAGG